MRVIKAGYEILDELNGSEILKKIERVARVCYKSEDLIKDGSSERMVRALVKRGHEAMLEHFSFSVKFIVDRGVSHEIVRHRMASYAQESTRYCNYSQDKHGNEITVIEPCYFEDGSSDYLAWYGASCYCEGMYFSLLRNDVTPQEARAVLPTSLKTEIVMTANLREWRHFFKLRAVGTTGSPHPQIKEVAVPLLKEVASKIPVVFDDLLEAVSNEKANC